MEHPRIKLQNIGKYYYSEAAVTQALRKIDLSFEMNEFVAITGESGSGKSTLLKLISGMDSFDEGEMYIDGEPTFQYDDDDWERYRREKIGYVFQDYSLIGHYTARDNIVSALLIMGMGQIEARQQADHYLERVGLQGHGEQMASKLSSGQKQRLSIARALAKGTDIIVADEPTGNLDSETGEQIVRLLKELSKDHLVIMVTHNYEQVEPYVTRKVRLHDGDLVLDVQVNQGSKQGTEPQENQEEQTEVTIEPADDLVSDQRDDILSDKQKVSKKVDCDKKHIHQVASIFARLNIRTQKGKAILFTTFFLVTAMVSFLFIGELLVNVDDRIAKVYDSSAFADKEMNRVSIRRTDNDPITEKDLETIRQIRHVTHVDQYDLIDDVNFYYKKNRDYQFRYGYDEYGDRRTGLDFLNDNHFMRSSTCITEDDLSAGRLPETREEIVLYSAKGEAVIGTEKTCYLRNENVWGSNEYIAQNTKVVGVLKEPTTQIYFSPALCQMLTASMSCGQYTLYFYYDREQGKYIGVDDFIPIIEDFDDNELQEDEIYMQVSENYQVPVDGYNKLPDDKESVFGGNTGYLDIFHYTLTGELQEEPVKIENTYVDNQNFHQSSNIFLAMSEEFFTENNDMNTYQASVYFTSYAKTTEVMRALKKAGYDAISTYQVSVTEYDEEKVTERLTMIAIALVVLIILMLAEVLILRSLMKIRIKDYFVMKFMGMKMKLMCRISYYEMGCYLIVALLLTMVLMHLAGIKFSFLHEMLYYYELPGYLVFIAYNLVTWLLTIVTFNHLLKGRMDE